MSVHAFKVNSSVDHAILVVENTNSVLGMLPYNIRRHGFIVHAAKTVADVSKVIETRGKVNMVIVDCSNKNSEEAHKSLVENVLSSLDTKSSYHNVPVIILSDNAVTLSSDSRARHVDSSLMVADIIGKVREIYKEILPSVGRKILKLGDITLNLLSYKVTRGDRSVHLGPTEFKILHYLMSDPKKVYSRKEIITHIWGDSDIEERTIDVHMNRLRSALRYNKNELPVVETIRGVGYCLRRGYTD